MQPKIISLIGMSNIGKSFWSKKLVNKGFRRFCCDDMIEEKLSLELTDLGYSGINDMSKWMGQPWEERYQKNQARYIDLETESMQEIILKIQSASKNYVIDTTGSLVHLSPKILSKLKELTKIVYLKASLSHNKELLRLYMTNPKPVVFGKIFKKNLSKKNQEALQKSFSNLLAWRSKKYSELADLEIQVGNQRESHSNFLEKIMA